MTPAEKRLWKLLRQLEGFHFRSQLALGSKTYDFGDHGLKLLIELDGGIHRLPEVQARDKEKEVWAESQGYRVLRIPNQHVFGTGEPAIVAVLAAAREQLARGAAPPTPTVAASRLHPTRGRGAQP